ncbi:MAG: glycine--tRNA ligase [Patescibacteria group bacterium]
MSKSKVKMEDIVSLCKRRGFIYQGSEVYGGLSGTWDYGPLGVALKRNIINFWWKTFVEDRDDMYGVDAAILMNQKVWQASGHVDTFTDPLVECNECGAKHRVDQLGIDEEIFSKTLNAYNNKLKILIKDFTHKIREEKEKNRKFLNLDTSLLEQGILDKNAINIIKEFSENIPEDTASYINLERLSIRIREMRLELIKAKSLEGPIVKEFLQLTNITCPTCKSNNWLTPRKFNMMFKTNVGPVADENSVSYLRPETAQGIFTNYKNVVDSFYPDVPFGIGQIGKAFRNEISPRDFVFRSREFEQMEIEYFIHPDSWEKMFDGWVKGIRMFLKELGLPEDSVHELEVEEADRAHYSKRTIDFEFDFPHKRDELLGLAYRTDFDLGNIQRVSGKNMEYRPKDGSEPFVPHVIEPSFGVERMIVAVLTSAYTEDEINGEKRTYLKLPAHLAPVKVAVSPLLKNKPELVAKAQEVYKMLKKEYGNVMYDDNGNIGKRYRRQDEIGTPYCITIDFDTLEDNTVTIRDRDTAEQKRISAIKIKGTIS